MTAVQVSLPPGNAQWIDPATGRPMPAFFQAMDALFRRTGGAPVDKVDMAATSGETATAAAASANAAAETAHEAAQTANSAAVTAQSAADTANSAVAVTTAYPAGLTITASADGATAKIVISDHQMIYPDKTVDVTGATLTGLDYDTTYSIYYDDPGRVGGAVTFHATTNGSDAYPSDTNPNRIYVGGTTTPATSADPDKAGIPRLPPGFGGGVLP